MAEINPPTDNNTGVRTGDSALGAGNSALREEAEAALRLLVGRADAALREDQWTAIEALVVGRQRVLVVQRTGWGKSAVYFVATALLRRRGAGPTIIVSPLLALMRDQIAAATRAGIRATTMNSSNVTEWDDVQANIVAGEVDVLLCSPERLNNPAFRDNVLPQLAEDAGFVVVDEAHCISDWGHDFRPDYRRIRRFIASLPAGVPVLATTATANARVTADVAEQLADSTDGNVVVLRGALDRESLQLGVLALPNAESRMAWLLSALPQFSGSGIVYCLTVAAAEQTASQLRRAGIEVQAYTGQTDPTERERLEGELKNNQVKALIATSALGMGFDKPDLSFVIHLGAPSSPIAYYQQIGRAGRGVDRAEVILLPGAEDKAIWDYFATLSFPDEERVQATLNALRASGTMSLASLETVVDLRRSRLESMLKVLDVDGAVQRVSGGWAATGTPWEYDGERYQRVAQARIAEQQLMIEYEATTQCRMAFLRGVLDDPELVSSWICGRCDNCNPVNALSAPEFDVAAIRESLRSPGIDIMPRKQWPTGMEKLQVSLRGRIPASEQAEAGMAIARLDGLGWSGPLRDLFAASTPDGELPVDLRHACAQLLTAWQKNLSPDANSQGDESSAGNAGADSLWDAVVGIASSSRPQLASHITHGLAKFLKIPVLGVIHPKPGFEEPTRHDVNSATRLAAVSRRLELSVQQPLEGKKILLVDDYTDSGWTFTVSARLLLRSGATQVYPLCLAQR